VLIPIGITYVYYVSVLVNHHQVDNQHISGVSSGGSATKLLNIVKMYFLTIFLVIKLQNFYCTVKFSDRLTTRNIH
jgi:hypothetical protein